MRKLEAERTELAPLEFTYFSDKKAIIEAFCSPGGSFGADMNEVKELRNEIDHLNDYAPTQEGLAVFLHRLRLVDHWIDELGGSEAARDSNGLQETSIAAEAHRGSNYGS